MFMNRSLTLSASVAGVDVLEKCGTKLGKSCVAEAALRLVGSDCGETEISGGKLKCSTNARSDCPRVKSKTTAWNLKDFG